MRGHAQTVVVADDVADLGRALEVVLEARARRPVVAAIAEAHGVARWQRSSGIPAAVVDAALEPIEPSLAAPPESLHSRSYLSFVWAALVSCATLACSTGDMDAQRRKGAAFGRRHAGHECLTTALSMQDACSTLPFFRERCAQTSSLPFFSACLAHTPEKDKACWALTSTSGSPADDPDFLVSFQCKVLGRSGDSVCLYFVREARKIADRTCPLRSRSLPEGTVPETYRPAE